MGSRTGWIAGGWRCPDSRHDQQLQLPLDLVLLRPALREQRLKASLCCFWPCRTPGHGRQLPRRMGVSLSTYGRQLYIDLQASAVSYRLMGVSFIDLWTSAVSTCGRQLYCIGLWSSTSSTYGRQLYRLAGVSFIDLWASALTCNSSFNCVTLPLEWHNSSVCQSSFGVVKLFRV